MFKQERFIHYQSTSHRARHLGFSVLMSPAPIPFTPKGEQVVWLTATLCNKNDKHFNKKIAREILRDRPSQQVRVIDLPKILNEFAEKCNNGYCSQSFDYVLRYFV